MHYQEQNLQNMNQTFNLYEFLKKLTQFILSFSIFSFFVLHPSSLPFFFRSFISNFSTFHSQLLNLATDKKYIFLLFNGILVFIAKYSSRTVNSHPSSQPETSSDNDIMFKQYTESLQPSTKKSVLVEDVATEVNEEEERSEADKAMPEEETEAEIRNFLITDDRQREGEVDHGIFIDSTLDGNTEYMKEEFESGSNMEEEEKEATAAVAEEEQEEEKEEEEEEEEIAKMSTEELNKKFDDFIRKMKEELRFEMKEELKFESQQQLIMV